jgi:hypothetical protein
MRTVFFEIGEVAALSGILKRTLLEWARLNAVVPKWRGRAGRYNTHQYSAQQLLGLTILGCIKERSRGIIGPTLARTLMLEAEKISDEDMDRWLRSGTEHEAPHDAEAGHSLEDVLAIARLAEDMPGSWLPRLDRVVQAMRRKAGYLKDNYRERIGAAEPRPRLEEPKRREKV